MDHSVLPAVYLKAFEKKNRPMPDRADYEDRRRRSGDAWDMYCVSLSIAGSENSADRST